MTLLLKTLAFFLKVRYDNNDITMTVWSLMMTLVLSLIEDVISLCPARNIVPYVLGSIFRHTPTYDR